MFGVQCALSSFSYFPPQAHAILRWFPASFIKTRPLVRKLIPCSCIYTRTFVDWAIFSSSPPQSENLHFYPANFVRNAVNFSWLFWVWASLEDLVKCWLFEIGFLHYRMAPISKAVAQDPQRECSSWGIGSIVFDHLSGWIFWCVKQRRSEKFVSY